MTDLPEGTLTLLFTDIEGSTGILARLGERYAEVVSAQRAVIRAAVARWRGTEMGTEGDSFFVVFRSVADALCAARDAQRELGRVAWPDATPVRVRMGLHTGEPTRHEDGYVGMDVHRAARVAASAHGGQVVLTESTYRIAVADGVPGLSFTSLGRHRLKDLPQPELLYQLGAEGLGTTFPRLRTLGSASSLPNRGATFVGRTQEVADLRALLGDPAVRLTTLTGPGGTGKTRLALAVAEALEATYPDGVYFVPLAPVAAGEVMWTTIAEVLGLTGEAKSPPTFLEFLASRRLLLVLDNLEQIPDAAEVVTQVLDRAPDVQVLATSRRPLRLSTEHVQPVQPLPVPAAGESVDGGAVELFVRRAQLVRPGFRLTEADAEDVREICRQLDGLPLAIELVAARAKLLSPRSLRARLDQSVESSRGAVDAPDRHRTLRSTLDWSYRLLPENLRAAFRRLGVCRGEVDLAAVEAVVGADGDALDDVAELLDASLLTVRDGPDGEPRVRMLQTVTRYAVEQLRSAGELDEVSLRHAQHFTSVAAEASARLRGEQHIRARDAIEGVLPNLRAALEWCFSGTPDTGTPDTGTPDTGTAGPGTPDAGHPTTDRLAQGLALCEHLQWFWYGCGYPAEGRHWLGVAVEATGGRLTRDTVASLHGLGVLVLQQGDAERARELLEACLRFWRDHDDPGALAAELNSLGAAYRALDDADRARELFSESIAVARAASDARREANALSNLAVLETDAGRPEAAIDLLRRVLVLDEQLGDTWGQGVDHVNLVGCLLRAGRLDEGHRHLADSAPAAVALGDVEITVSVLSLLCAGHAMRGDAGRAARLLGASERIREAADLPMSGQDATWFESVLAPVRDQPDTSTWQRHLAVGRDLDVEAALAEGLSP